MLKVLLWIHRIFSRPIDAIGTNGNSSKVFRCQVDGKLVTSSQASLRLHGGHMMKTPVYLNPVERLAIKRAKTMDEIKELIDA